MKIWQKVTTWVFDETIVSWRHQDISKFFWKIFSWLLGGFVFGILASIFFIAISRPDYAQPTARIVFFAVFIVGVSSNFFRAIISGFEYSITKTALIYSHPFFGWEKLGQMFGSEKKPFRHAYYYMNWVDVKEIREHEKGLELVMKNDEVLEIPVIAVTKLALNLNLKGPDPKEKGASKSEKLAYDKAVQRIVLQTAREARKSALN
jgi:hypothetical protein